MSEPIRDVETAVRKEGALPVPTGTADLTAEQRAAVADLIGDAQPATGRLLEQLAQSVRDRLAHDHATQREDWFCMNLTSFMGERMGPVLRRLLDAEARAERYRIAWGMARTRAISTGGAADRYAARARDAQEALQHMLFTVIAGQMALKAATDEVAELRTALEQRTTLLRQVQATARRRAAEAEGRKAYGDRLAAENERLRARLAEYERPADEDPIAFALTEQAVSVELPHATVRCGCGHPGSEHHHVGAKCWARLPRELGQPVRICPCAAFAPVSVDESADRLARYMAPTEGAE
jgi:hypothetical protein